jgi:hypothetical protein
MQRIVSLVPRTISGDFFCATVPRLSFSKEIKKGVDFADSFCSVSFCVALVVFSALALVFLALVCHTFVLCSSTLPGSSLTRIPPRDKMSSFPDIKQLRREYCECDPNEETRAAMLDYASDDPELAKRLQTRLQFGTAGLRGPMGTGYNQMNDLVVLQTTQGLIEYVDETQKDDAVKNKSVIIGYDHRCKGTLSSKGFARISAAVFLSKGWTVYLLEEFAPTPFVAFGVRHLKCAVGIMVTASHNPKQDNGFKVYWNTGSQIIPPHDTGIAGQIALNLKPWVQNYDTAGVELHENASIVTESIATAYYKAITTLSDERDRNSNSTVNTVYTAMHGKLFRGCLSSCLRFVCASYALSLHCVCAAFTLRLR